MSTIFRFLTLCLSFLIAVNLSPLPVRYCFQEVSFELQGVYALLLLLLLPLNLIFLRGARRIAYVLLAILLGTLGMKDLWVNYEDSRVVRAKSLPLHFQPLTISTRFDGASDAELPLGGNEVRVEFRSGLTRSTQEAPSRCFLTIKDSRDRVITVRSHTYSCSLIDQATIAGKPELGAVLHLSYDGTTVPLVVAWPIPGCSEEESETNYLMLRRPSTELRRFTHAFFVGMLYDTVWGLDYQRAKGLADLDPLLPLSHYPVRAFVPFCSKKPTAHLFGRGFETVDKVRETAGWVQATVR